MTAQSTAPRSRAPKTVDTDDVVLARAIEFTAWARTNIRLIVIAAVVLFVLVAGLLYWRSYQADRRERAATEFMQLEQTVASGNTALAVRDLERYIARFEGTDPAREAKLMLARMRLQQGQPAAAIAAVRDLAGEAGESNLGAQGALLLAAAQHAAGQTEAAVSTYLRVADEAELRYVRVDALSSAALLRMQTGDPAGAAELYQRLVEQAEEGSLERSVFEMRRAEAEALAQAATR